MFWKLACLAQERPFQNTIANHLSYHLPSYHSSTQTITERSSLNIHISNTPSDSMGQSFLLPSSLSSICSKDRGLDLDSNCWLTILQGIWLISVLWLIQICFFFKAILSRKLFLSSLFVFKTTAFSLDFKAWESYAYVQIYFTIFW